MENYKLQYVSDIHLEKDRPNFSLLIQPSAPDLALCGDIGDPYSQTYADFLSWCSKHWQRVFIITGNHEYFTDTPQPNKTMDHIDHHIATLCNRISNNLFFLQKSIYFIEEYKIAVLGATLWSAPDIRHWDLLTGQSFIGDPGLRGEYNAVFTHDTNTNTMRPLHPSDITNIHLNHKAFLQKELGPFGSNIPKDYRVIVLTHHMPTFELNEAEFADHPLRSNYASNLDDLIKEPVVAWLCGHSHGPKTLRFPSGPLVSLNPLGYKTQDKKLYSRTASITVYRENIAIRHD